MNLNFDLSRLPIRLRAYVESIIETTDADPVMVVMSVLCMSSAFVKKACYIPESSTGSGGYFQRLYPNLWVVCISPSGSFKTTALNKGFKLAYDNELSLKTSDPQKLSTSKLTLLPNRVTTEALLQALSEGSGGAIVCSEFGEWLETLERTYNQGLKPLLTDLYDVPKIYSYRTKGGGQLNLYEPFITICGASTFEWIKKNVTKDDVTSGFFARFLLFNPPQTNKIPQALPSIKKEVSQDVEKTVQAILASIPEPRAYSLNADSQKIFTEFHQGLYKGIFEYHDSARSFIDPYIKRWSPYVLKIGILLQLFIDQNANVISIEAMSGAISIVDYAVRSTTWLFENELGESDHQRKVRKVVEYISKRGGYVTRGKLLRSKVLTGGLKDYDYVLDNLEQMGRLRIDNKSSKGEMGLYLEEEY